MYLKKVYRKSKSDKTKSAAAANVESSASSSSDLDDELGGSDSEDESVTGSSSSEESEIGSSSDLLDDEEFFELEESEGQLGNQTSIIKADETAKDDSDESSGEAATAAAASATTSAKKNTVSNGIWNLVLVVLGLEKFWQKSSLILATLFLLFIDYIKTK